MSNKKVDTRYLMIPMWNLFKVDKIEYIRLDKDSANWYIKGYELKDRRNIYTSLISVESNPNYNFLEIIKDAPDLREIEFSNLEIFEYLINFKKFMENEKYGLLTDDRPTNYPWEK